MGRRFTVHEKKIVNIIKEDLAEISRCSENLTKRITSVREEKGPSQRYPGFSSVDPLRVVVSLQIPNPGKEKKGFLGMRKGPTMSSVKSRIDFLPYSAYDHRNLDARIELDSILSSRLKKEGLRRTFEETLRNHLKSRMGMQIEVKWEERYSST